MTNNISGLTQHDVVRARELHGDNSLKREKKRGFLSRFFENLSDPIIKILLFALGAQIIFTLGKVNYLEIGGIICAILISTTVSTISEYRSERAFEKLKAEEGESVSVLRDGVITKITIEEIVVGDIIYLSYGEKVPADGEIVSGRVGVDQSALNGESAEQHKFPSRDNRWDLSSPSKLFRGSLITSGSAIMRVERVGENSFFGMVAKDVQTETRVSPLKLRLGKLAEQISKIGYFVAVLVGIAYVFNAVFVANEFDGDRIRDYILNFPGIFSCLVSAMTLMITVIVVAAPEGLPMMIAVVLSANLKRMLNDNILVKKLVGIETAGSMNILFTDKTGTITYGKPKCEYFITNDSTYSGISSIKRAGEIYSILTVSAMANTDVYESNGELMGGNPTDRAIYECLADKSASIPEICEKTPFTSERKYSSVRLKNGKTLIKGAAESILSLCTSAMSTNGEKTHFNFELVKKHYVNAAQKCERVVAVAISDKGETDLCFVALIVMKDKIRDNVFSAIKQANSAGIQIVMITGDSKETASAVAEECGIYNPRMGHMVLSGDEIRKMNDMEIKNILPTLRVVCRALPQDKTRLVRISQELNLVVGMTGDGINDAPSLKLADVGFSMGSGTDIAKSASDIVILDNSFLAITKTVLYGRTIFKSIRKFITFQLTMNLAACGVSLLGQFIGIQTPITIIQMLWVNIIMDTLGGLAFAGEAPMKYYMMEKPIKRDEQILSRDMLSQIILTGLYTLAICLVFLTSPRVRYIYGGVTASPKLYTAFYALFIFFGIFNCLCARCSRLWLLSGIGKNKPFVVIMLVISLIQIAMIYLGGSIFRCVPLLLPELSFAILLSSTVLPFEMLRRLVYKMK